MKTPIIIGGQKIGRLRASFLLFKESWRFLRADKELLLVPIFSSVLSVMLIGLLTFAVMMIWPSFSQALQADAKLGVYEYVYLFGVYVCGAFSLAIAQAIIVHIVYVRAHGGNATLSGGIARAFASWWPLLIWAIITSTVGLVLRIISDRSALVGKIVAGLLGAAWSILTFFAVPIILIEKKQPTKAIDSSARLFKQTWGETLVANVTLGLFFMIAHLVALASFIGLLIYGTSINNAAVMIWAMIGVVIWIVVASLINSALQGILKTLLYIYAAENVVPDNFNRELLESMLVTKKITPKIIAQQETPTATEPQVHNSSVDV